MCDIFSSWFLQTSSATTERCNMLSAANDSHAACEKVTITKSFSGEEVL